MTPPESSAAGKVDEMNPAFSTNLDTMETDDRSST